MKRTRRQIVWECIFPTFFILMMLMAALLIFSIAGSAVISLTGISEAIIYYWNKYSDLLMTLLAYVLTLFGLRHSFQYDEIRYGIDPRRTVWQHAVIAILFTFAIAELCSSLIDLVGISRIFTSYQESAESMFQGQNPLLLIITTVILGPLTEEMVFRGLTYRRIRSYVGVRKAILFSALLFGIYHMNIVQFLFAFVVGCLFAWLYEKSGTLLVSIGAHMLINLYAAIYNMQISYFQAHPQTLRYITAVQVILAIVAGGILFKKRNTLFDRG